MPTEYPVPSDVQQISRRALPIGVLLLIACLAGGWFSPDQFFHSYLLGYIFVLNIAIGCMGVAMIQNLSGGNWGILTRRLLEAGARTMPLLALFFIPILFGLKTLYPWARPDAINDPVIQAKALYLNVPFFIGRAVAYFVIWTTLAHFLVKWSREQDRTGDPRLVRKLGKLSGGGLVIYGITITFAVIDWFMSMQPHWFSTIFGMIFMAGEGLSAFSFVILMLSWFVKRDPMKAIVTPKHLIDLGNLMLAFVILWTYTSFSQFLLIWAGNLPEEISFYLPRFRNGWQYIAIALVLFHFAVPFLLLLQRSIKGKAARVGLLALMLVAARWVDMYWLVAPTIHPSFYLSWMDVAAPLALGGIWLTLWVRNLHGASLIPVRDPYLETALQYGHHHAH